MPRGAAADVDRAVKAARKGFASWSRLPVEERAQWLEKLSAAMKTRVPQIAEAIAHEVGTAIGFATKVQAEFPIMMIGMNAKFIREAARRRARLARHQKEAISAWRAMRSPLHQVVCKIAGPRGGSRWSQAGGNGPLSAAKRRTRSGFPKAC